MRQAGEILAQLGTPCLIHQPKYSMFERWIETGLQDTLDEYSVGSIAFSPLAGGLLTDRYLAGIPLDSRVASDSKFLNPEQLSAEKLAKIRQLNELALDRGQKLSQMSLAWVLRSGRVTSALIGASKISQIDDAVGMLANTEFSDTEIKAIENILV